ncbi:collagen-like protein [Bacillus mycoides]|uniref:collagen-like protein n=1 Tax=Bacillus mycoides TaxID=1405 RepID=UPI002111AAA9|nr:collagen-like protein [Bacillus mycoides]MCQ6530587.1 collagen-like protein [Bacillus mycoides]
MGKTKEELKAVFVTGHKPTQQDFAELIDVTGVQGPKGDAGTQGLKGDTGAKGADGKNGVGVKSISLTVDSAGKLTGGTWIGTDDKSNAITITS